MAAIKALHAINICYRDLKPENIMMMEDDVTVKLIDFNGARVAGDAGICHTYIGN